MALIVQEHLSRAQIKERWKKCKDPVEKGHWQVIWLASEEKRRPNASQLGRQLGIHHSWVGRLVKRYNEHGPEGLADRRRQNRSQGLLDKEDLRELRRDLDKAPAEGGLWNGPKVAAWMSRRLKRPVQGQVGWLYLKRLGMSLQVPRPRHHQSASDQEKKAYKKNRGRSQKAGRKPSG
jgi:transposase